MIPVLFAAAAAAGVIWTGISWLAHRAVVTGFDRALRISDVKRTTRLRAIVDTVSGRAARRRQRQLAELPDFLDLLALGLSAGLTLEDAWAAALASAPRSPLTDRLRGFQRAIHVGRTRRSALWDVASSLDDERLSGVFALIDQAMTRGTALHEVLHDQARALRHLRVCALEKKAQTVGLRLLLPIFLFIFPTVFLLLFAPLAIRLSQGAFLF